ncbi:hypothetical protein QA646_01585 [Rhizobium sp. CB3090]|uniref:hypothetical protein n=1 Tax=Rhizobium sp. CB3090 TaxID=3039156 RepID=UPI0024B09967|nr:hypothetical protein [Rhizobium sp. CB3090]WFU09589.1 hypothetical protein QA646_01585 [Rhizobium sp. CB3090]
MADRAQGNVRSLQGLTAILAALSLALFAWIYAGFVRAFSDAAAGEQMLDARIGGYERGDVIAMLRYLKDHPDPAAILHSMYLGPELIFPLVLAGLLFCLLRLVGPGGTFFGKPIPPAVIALITAGLLRRDGLCRKYCRPVALSARHAIGCHSNAARESAADYRADKVPHAGHHYHSTGPFRDSSLPVCRRFQAVLSRRSAVQQSLERFQRFTESLSRSIPLFLRNSGRKAASHFSWNCSKELAA